MERHDCLMVFVGVFRKNILVDLHLKCLGISTIKNILDSLKWGNPLSENQYLSTFQIQKEPCFQCGKSDFF